MTHEMFSKAKNFLRTSTRRRAIERQAKLRRALRIEGLEKRVVFDASYFALSGGSLSQDWTNAALIAANDDWSGVPSIVGFLGQDIVTTTGVDLQTITGTSVAANDVDVIANQASPDTLTSGGAAEFDGIANPVVAIQGSGTADVPYLQLHLNSTGRTSVRVQANLRDVDGGADNSIQQINVQYRVGTTGAWSNVVGGYFADVTTGATATQVTPLDVTLPVAANNVSQLQVRIMTTNAVGSDEWVGIDDIVVSSTPGGDLPPNVTITPVSPNPRATTVDTIAIVFTEVVQNFDLSDLSLTRNGGANLLTGSQTLTSGDNTTFTLGNLGGITGAEGTYLLTLSVSNITDLTANALSAGDVESWVTDTSGPTVATLTPPDNSTSIFSEDNLVVVFSETVVKGTGNITVHLQSNNSVVSTIDVASTDVTVAGNTVTINPLANLPLNTGLYVNIPATAFADPLANPFAGITNATTWNFTTTGVSAVIAQQNFNELAVQTANIDAVADTTQLTNNGSFNTGGPQLDFTSTWFSTRGNLTGPNLGAGVADIQDFIGVNSFTGGFSPNVSAAGTPVSATETNFEINDTDGTVTVTFEPVSVAGFSDRVLTFNYWISATDFEAGDIFRARISDGTNSTNFIDFDSVAMNANESLDNGTANWRTASVNLENLIDNLGYGTTLTLSISVSNTDDTGADNVFIDNILFRGTSDVLAPEIDVRGNSISIVDGDITPSTTDATSFGTAILNSTAATATFTIANTGNTALNLSGAPLVSISGSPNFTVTTQPTSPVALGGGTTTFVVTFTPTTLGLQTATISINSNDSDESPYNFDVSGTVSPPPPTIFINEVDSDTPTTDIAEFIELYDGGVGNTSLTGLVVVLYNGSNDLSYGAFDLDGFTTDANGFFLLRNAGVGSGGLIIPDNTIQNGADAVAIYLGDAANFPNNTPLNLTSTLIDAVVYDTNDADDAGLLTLITAGGQIDETGTTTADVNAVARVPNGGTLRNSSNFVAQAPTPGATNSSVVAATITNRQVFYNNSVGFGTSGANNSTTVNPINAIDPSKTALVPNQLTTLSATVLGGQNASSANFTNYSRGLNGIVVDINGATNLAGIDAASFQFATWSSFPDATPNFVTISPTVTVSTFAGGGLSGAGRIKLVFADNAIQESWLRVTVLANANTGLTAPDVFYFGNARGDITPNASFPAQIGLNALDLNQARNNQLSSGAVVSNIYDVDKNGAVNGLDLNQIRARQGTNSLRPFTAPSSQAFLAANVPPITKKLSIKSLDSIFSGLNDSSF
jgi:Bacterial Ig-like domain